MKTCRLVILFSGEGSNMESIIHALHGKEFNDKRIEISAVITNNPDANGINRAKRLGIQCEVLNHRDFETREEFDSALCKLILTYSPSITILAGFMRILTPVFTSQIRALNIHPSLLPLFKGAHAIRESFDSCMKVAGVSVHFVSEELDSGAIVAQEAISKIDGEDFLSFKERIHALEHSLYPAAILKVLET
ncbi:MAG: phosphoribosylglycinamide formyltransferase [Wolinella sp.]